MCSSTLTVSLLLVANLNFGFRKLYRVIRKLCQFCSNVTLSGFIPLILKTVFYIQHLIEVLDGVKQQILKSVREYLCNSQKAYLNLFSPLMNVVIAILSQGGDTRVNRINTLKKNSNRINFHVGMQMLNLVTIRRFFTFLGSCIVNYKPQPCVLHPKAQFSLLFNVLSKIKCPFFFPFLFPCVHLPLNHIMCFCCAHG